MSKTQVVFSAREAWFEEYRDGWLRRFDSTGETDWSLYPKTPRLEPITGPAIDLSSSKLLFISSAGAYRPAEQSAFEAANPLGDYSVRACDTVRGTEGLRFAHDHYDHQAVERDVGVLLPLTILEQGVQSGRVGSLTPTWVSFMGYQPDLTRIESETLPAILEIADANHAGAALLVPS